MRSSQQRGFTLIETMVTAAVIAIVAAIAIPNYRSYTLRSNRAVAQNILLQVSAREQNFFADNKSFTIDGTDMNFPAAAFSVDKQGNISGATTADSVYRVTIGQNTDFDFTATATAVNRQLDDTDCKTFSIDEQGTRTATDSGGASAPKCW